MSADPENEYFCDGITEEILNALAQLPGLRVPARTSSFAFKGKHVPAREIARQLQVAYVLERSVRRAGDRVRIAAQLSDARTDEHLWSRIYDRELKDVFAIQEEIARAITEGLRLRLGEEVTIGRTWGRTSIEAYDLYLRGRFIFYKFTPDAMWRSLDYYRQALEKDSMFAQAYAGIADAWSYLADLVVAPLDAYPKAREAALKAIELEPDLAEAHAALSTVLLFHDRNIPIAEREIMRAIELNPNSFEAYFTLGLLHPPAARMADAFLAAKHAQEIDPLSPSVSLLLEWLYYMNREYDQAIKQHHRAAELGPNIIFVEHRIADAYREKRIYTEALAEYERARQLLGDRPPTGLAIAYARMGELIRAREVLAEVLAYRKQAYVPASGIAQVHAALGETERAFEWLEIALNDRDGFLIWLRYDLGYDTLRTDPRFVDFLQKVWLPSGEDSTRVVI
jgi:serine/threonine-protein kinase